MSRIHLKQIEVRELFGRTFDLKLPELSDHVTVVYGPNAAGKTTLAMGASRIFNANERRRVDRSDRIRGVIKIDDQCYEVDMAGPKVTPPWPQSSRVDLYPLSISELIAGPDEEDHGRIREALAGGLDSQKLAVPKCGRAPKQDLDSAMNRLREKRQNAEHLRRRESELSQKHDRLAKATEATEDLRFVNRWLEAADYMDEANARQSEISRIQTEQVGIERQTESAVRDVQNDWNLYQSARSQLRNAGMDLRSFGGCQARRELQAADADRFARLTTIGERLDAALAEAERNKQQTAGQRNDAQRALTSHRPDGVRAPYPLVPTDAQNLAELVEKVEQKAQIDNEANARSGESERTLAAAQTAYRNADDDPDRHPISAPSLDQVHRAIELDTHIDQAVARFNRAEEVCAKTQNSLGAAKMNLLGVRVPARDVMEELQKEPKISVLTDRVRELDERKTAFGLVAYQLGEDTKARRLEAEGAEVAAEALRDWLRAIPAGEVASKAIVVIVFAFVIAAASLAITTAVNSLVGCLLGVAGLITVALILLLRRPKRRGGEDSRPAAAQRVPDRWRPKEWTTDKVTAQFAAAVEKTREILAAERAARDAQIRADQIDESEDRNCLNDRRSKFTAVTGVSVSDGYNLADMVHRIQRLGDAEDEFAAAELTRAQAESAHLSLQEERRGVISEMGAPSQTGASAKVWADVLRSLIAAESAHATNSETCTIADSDLFRAKTALQEFFLKSDWPTDGNVQAAKVGFLKWFELTEHMVLAEDAVAKAEDELTDLRKQIASLLKEIRALFESYKFPCPENPLDGAQSFRDWFEMTRVFSKARLAARISRQQLLNRLDGNGVAKGSLKKRSRVPEARHDLCQQRRQLERERNDLKARSLGIRSAAGWEEAFDRLNLGREPSREQLQTARQRLTTIAGEQDRLKQEITETTTLIKQACDADDLAGAERSLADAVSKLDAWLGKRLNEIVSKAVKERITQAERDEAQPAVVRAANAWLARLTAGRFRDLDANDEMVSVMDCVEENRRKRIDQLSTGIRTHLALAVRLAVIETSEIGGHRFPLFLDEVMATSDLEASRAIGRALVEIAKDRQIVVLTNQPDDLNILREAFEQTLHVISLTGSALSYVPPAAAPAADSLTHGDGLPITSSIDQWPPALLSMIVPELNFKADKVYAAIYELDLNSRKQVEMRLIALEAVRAQVAHAHRRLQWGDIETQAWITENFRARIQQALEATNGEPRAFLIHFCEIERMRDDKKRDCEQWLNDNGYIADPPTLDGLTEVACGKLPENYSDRRLVAKGLAAFFAAYASR